MNPRITPKERGLIKGALRRVFSRSELRKTALAKADAPGVVSMNRPRVKKWSTCPICVKYIPTYLMQVDHVNPIIPLDMSLQEISWDTLIDNIWCNPSNLVAMCKECHLTKTKEEGKIRRANKKEKNNVKRCKSVKRPSKTSRKGIIRRRTS